jgi:hypothetical protein
MALLGIEIGGTKLQVAVAIAAGDAEATAIFDRAAVAAHLHGFVVEALRPPPPVLLAALGDLVVPVGAALLACLANKETRTDHT